MFSLRTKNKNPYHQRTLGNPKTLNSLTRKKLLAWKKANYQPGNMILSVAGNFEKKEILEVIKKTFVNLEVKLISFINSLLNFLSKVLKSSALLLRA